MASTQSPARKSRSKKTVVPMSSSFSGFFNGLRTLASGPQFYWYLTHVSTVACTLLCIFDSFVFGSASPETIRYYSLALSSILTTYLIILRQTYKHRSIAFFISQGWHLINYLLTPKNKRNLSNSENLHGMNNGTSIDANTMDAGVQRTARHSPISKSQSSPVDKSNIMRDENFQYLMFALSHWLFASPMFGAINPSVLYSFAIYALFHSSNYFQQNILPILPLISADAKTLWKSRISGFYRIFNERSKMVASNTEVLLVAFYIVPLLKLFFKLATARFWSSPEEFWYDVKIVNLFIVTVTFLRARYAVDSHVRQQVDNYDASINRLIESPYVPLQAKQVMLGMRKVTGDFVEYLSVT